MFVFEDEKVMMIVMAFNVGQKHPSDLDTSCCTGPPRPGRIQTGFLYGVAVLLG